ncbi:Acylpyruvase fahd1, mitochondrial [Geranomyces variabilis]|nr:Acylpyruvase fahd1, mitochondrial [Geranomyces variabilis]
MSPPLRTFTAFGKKIVCVGRNYAAHAAELGNPLPKTPLLFLKPSTSYVQAPRPFALPAPHVLHHEIELGVIIAKTASNVTAANADSYIGGYCLALDMTARDIQDAAKKAKGPWTIAKGMDGFTPVSEMVPKEAVKDPQNLRLWLKVDGKLVQDGSTKDMIFEVPRLIAYISKFMTLERGDVILTGTPEGVGPVHIGQTMEGGLETIGSSTPLTTLSVPVVERLPKFDINEA